MNEITLQDTLHSNIDELDIKIKKTLTIENNTPTPFDATHSNQVKSHSETTQLPYSSTEIFVTPTTLENIQPPQDEHNISLNAHTADLIDLNEKMDETIKVNVENPLNPPRIDLDELETEQDYINFYINETARRYRLFKYENQVDTINKMELEDALFDALEEINQYTPQTAYNLEYFAKQGRRYRKLLLMGTAKNALLTLISESASNGVDVSIEDLSMSNKLSDLQGLYDNLKEQFNETLEKMKGYDRLVIRRSTFSTGSSKFQTSFVARMANIYKSGGWI